MRKTQVNVIGNYPTGCSKMNRLFCAWFRIASAVCATLVNTGQVSLAQGCRLLTVLALAGLAGLCGPAATAGVMTREAMLQAFPAPLIVGEKAKDLPVWPLLKQDATSTPVVAYAFESIDLAPIPGFSGTPMNLLVTLDANGQFLQVRVLSQHEPVFLDGLGPQPLAQFVAQYQGLSLKQNIKIGSKQNRGSQAGSVNVYIDGVAKATASVRILNQTLLSSSLKVARAKLGFGDGRDPDLVAHLRLQDFTAMDWDGLQHAGLISSQTWRQSDIDQAFKGSTVGGQSANGAGTDPFMQLNFAWLNVPTVGRNLLGEKGWQALQQRLDPGDQALLFVSTGSYSLLGPDFVRGAVPDRLTLRQQNLPIEIRDLDFDVKPQLPAALQNAEWRVFKVIAAASLDPALPLDFKLQVTRSKGVIYPERVRREFDFSSELPSAYYDAASADNKGWPSIWRARWPEILLLLLGLAVLALVLRRPQQLTLKAQRLLWFRRGYLLFTLGFIGFYAQGQLSIVNLTAWVQAIAAWQSLQFFLFDPMTVLLWVAVLASVVFWGRGLFCGWLCPFGALQEWLADIAKILGLRQRRLPERWDRWGKRVKHGLLLLILVVAIVAPSMADKLVEIEPFKTSITLNFVRAWLFVLWAVALLALNLWVYKAYCRYLCPLGAGMVWLGRLRRFDWIARRSECGQPCQRCRHDCAYQAIERSGAIDYDECFQCLDCVAIYDSADLCVPLILEKRQTAHPVIPIVRQESP